MNDFENINNKEPQEKRVTNFLYNPNKEENKEGLHNFGINSFNKFKKNKNLTSKHTYSNSIDYNNLGGNHNSNTNSDFNHFKYSTIETNRNENLNYTKLRCN